MYFSQNTAILILRENPPLPPPPTSDSGIDREKVCSASDCGGNPAKAVGSELKLVRATGGQHHPPPPLPTLFPVYRMDVFRLGCFLNCHLKL